GSRRGRRGGRRRRRAGGAGPCAWGGCDGGGGLGPLGRASGGCRNRPGACRGGFGRAWGSGTATRKPTSWQLPVARLSKPQPTNGYCATPLLNDRRRVGEVRSVRSTLPAIRSPRRNPHCSKAVAERGALRFRWLSWAGGAPVLTLPVGR